MTTGANIPPGVDIGQDDYWADKSSKHIAACSLSIGCVLVAIPLRFLAQSLPSSDDLKKEWLASRFRWRRAMGKWDFWFVLIAGVLAIGTTACNIVPYHYGLGKQLIRVLKEDPHPPGNLASAFMYGYVVKVLHIPSLMFTKLSIIIFYHRLFSQTNQHIRWALYAVAVWSIILGVAATVEFILACIPASFSWNQVYILFGGKLPDGTVPTGWCMPTALSVCIPLVCDLVSEITLLLIPAVALWNIHLSRRKKIGVYLTFTLGGFVTAISAIRIYHSWMLDNVSNITWDQAEPFIWTSVQVCFGAVCACIPAMAPLYRLVQRKYDSTANSLGYRTTNRPWFGSTREASLPSRGTYRDDYRSNSSQVELQPVEYGPAAPTS